MVVNQLREIFNTLINSELLRLVIFTLNGLLVGYFVRKLIIERRLRAGVKKSKAIIADAEKRAQEITREATAQVKSELYEMRKDFENHTRERRRELGALERRLVQKEANLEKKLEVLEKREEAASNRERDISGRQKAVKRRDEELDRLLGQQRKRLQELSGLTAEEAKRMLFQTRSRTAFQEGRGRAQGGVGQEGEEDTEPGDPAVRRGSCGGVDGLSGAFAQRRDERANNRARGPQYKGSGKCHGYRCHH
jgi:hypothetical protein